MGMRKDWENISDMGRVDKTLFHGGCHECTQRQINGVGFCKNCCYRHADWSKPNLNNEGLAVRKDDIRNIVREELEKMKNAMIEKLYKRRGEQQ